MTEADEKRLTEIKARAKAATPGPWESGNNAIYSALSSGGHVVLAASAWAECGRKGDFYECGSARAACALTLSTSDKLFIAHARDDIPALLAHIRALEAEIAALKEAVRREREECPCDRESAVDPHCAAAGMCARESDNG